MKFFMSSLAFNILSRKSSDEKKFRTVPSKTVKVQRMEEIVSLVVEEIDVMA